MSEHTAEKDAAIAALERLADQAFHTAGDLVGRARVSADRATALDALGAIHAVDRFPVEQEFAVVVAALLAGRLDGQQAVASLVAIHNREARVLPPAKGAAS
jgi:hypothetical protein